MDSIEEASPAGDSYAKLEESEEREEGIQHFEERGRQIEKELNEGH